MAIFHSLGAQEQTVSAKIIYYILHRLRTQERRLGFY